MADAILTTKNLRKTFSGKKGKGGVEAVAGIDLEVKRGKIFGFLGPNGAGKTTTLNMLTTLLVPTAGQATVVGFDLLKHPEKIRNHIGYVSQAGGSDMSANAYDNLILQAQLYGSSKAAARSRAETLVEQFQISEFATRLVRTYSGGQKRRVDLALGVVHQPQLLFLDEPTTGLDPQSRAYFWNEIKNISKSETTVFLTTHYLEEADNLCDYVAIIDHGTLVAQGSPADLKRQIGLESITVGLKTEKDVEKGKALLEKEKYVKKLLTGDLKLHLYVKEGEKVLVDIIRLLDEKKVGVATVELSKPSLDDVFLQKTGRSLREGGS